MNYTSKNTTLGRAIASLVLIVLLLVAGVYGLEVDVPEETPTETSAVTTIVETPETSKASDTTKATVETPVTDAVVTEKVVTPVVTEPVVTETEVVAPPATETTIPTIETTEGETNNA